MYVRFFHILLSLILAMTVSVRPYGFSIGLGNNALAEEKKPSEEEIFADYLKKVPDCQTFLDNLSGTGLHAEAKVALHAYAEATENVKRSFGTRALDWLVRKARGDTTISDPRVRAFKRTVYDKVNNHEYPQTVIFMGMRNFLNNEANDTGKRLIEIWPNHRIAMSGEAPWSIALREDSYWKDNYTERDPVTGEEERVSRKIKYFRAVSNLFRVQLYRQLIKANYSRFVTFLSTGLEKSGVINSRLHKPFQHRSAELFPNEDPEKIDLNDPNLETKVNYLEGNYHPPGAEDFERTGGDIRAIAWTATALTLGHDIYMSKILNSFYTSDLLDWLLIGLIANFGIRKFMDIFNLGVRKHSPLKPIRSLLGRQPPHQNAATIYRTSAMAPQIIDDLMKVTDKESRKPLIVIVDDRYIDGLAYELTEKAKNPFHEIALFLTADEQQNYQKFKDSE